MKHYVPNKAHKHKNGVKVFKLCNKWLYMEYKNLFKKSDNDDKCLDLGRTVCWTQKTYSNFYTSYELALSLVGKTNSRCWNSKKQQKVYDKRSYEC